MRALLPVLLAALAAPHAAALDLRLDPLDGPLTPLAETGVVHGVLHVPCEGLPADATVRLAVEAPAWLEATPVPRSLAPDCDDGSVAELAFHVAVRASERAPALTPGELSVTAALEAPNATRAARNATQVAADYYGVLDATLLESVKQGPPQSTLAFPLRVTNHGNGVTRFGFEILEAPPGWQVLAPLPVVLQSRAENGTHDSAIVNVMVLTPYRNGHLNEVGAVTLRVHGAHALHPHLKGDATEVSLLATARGWYVPSPALPLALAGVAAVAVALRRTAR